MTSDSLGLSRQASEVSTEAPIHENAPLFAVGLVKLSLLSITTFGLYEIFWFYKNIRMATRPNCAGLKAGFVTLFFPLIAYFLFKDINKRCARLGETQLLNAAGMAVAVFLGNLLWRLPAPYYLFGFLSLLPLLLAQSLVNQFHAQFAPDLDMNEHLSIWNILCIVVGSIVLVLVALREFGIP